MPRYKTVDTASSFIGWGKLGQEVELKVLTFEPTGGKDFNGKACPRVVGTLVEDCDNYKDLRGDKKRVQLKAGEQVTVEGGVENLRKGLLQADPQRGDFLRLSFVDTYETDRGDGKVIKVEHAKGEAGAVSADDI